MLILWFRVELPDQTLTVILTYFLADKPNDFSKNNRKLKAKITH